MGRGRSGSPLTVSIVPTGAHQLMVKATGANAGFATLLGTTSVGSDGVGEAMAHAKIEGEVFRQEMAKP